jgi:hypothetical protein
VDSLRAVVERLEQFRLTPLSAVQLPGLIRDGRAALEGLTALRDEVGALDDDVRAGFSSLQEGVGTLPELRAQDLAYARSLLNIPSLEAPELSPALFGETALTWLKPVLFWARTAERYLPPGLDPRNRPGPERTRAEGVTVEFPGRATYPAFTIGQGELGLEIGGTGLAAGQYSAQLRDLTTAPSLLGRPMELVLARAAGAAEGPRELSLAVVLDHTGDVIRDSVTLSMVGVELPELDLDVFGGALALGEGTTRFDLSRVGGEIDARLHWVSDDLTWLAGGGEAEGAPGDGSGGAGAAGPPGESGDEAAAPQGPQAAQPAIGSAEWAEALIARTISGIERVELDMGLQGSMDSPSLSISSNLGQAVAESLRAELGQEIEAAEARLRAEIDERVQPLIQEARGGVDAVRTGVVGEVAAQRREVEELRARLEERLQALVGS